MTQCRGVGVTSGRGRRASGSMVTSRTDKCPTRSNSLPSVADKRRDRVEKMDEHAAFGVRFYWLADPALGAVEIFG